MFKGYGKSRFRIGVLGALMVACVVGMSHFAMAADGAAGPAAQHPNIMFEVFDWVVIVALVSASIAGIAMIIDCVIHIKEARIAPVESTEHIRSLINSRQFKELLDFTATDQSFVSQALNAGLRRAHLKYPAMREALESATSEQSANLFRRIEMLNVIGNIGPLIGLLGTVLGMIMAFNALGVNGGTPRVDQLAPGIAAALYHTFGGLFVAIPCLITFGYFRTKIDKIAGRATLISEELLESLKPSDSAAPATAAPASVPAARPVPRRAPAAPAPE